MRPMAPYKFLRPPQSGKIPAMHAPVITTGRDLRLDLFRGIALWLIFLDHIPSNLVAWITIRNYGFSDATEIFVFVSGYTAAFVYGRQMRERGFVIAGAQILRRAWQIYVAHVFLFAIYLAEITYLANSFENPLYAEETNILDFLKQPDATIIQALLLKFKPANMDVLPLYIVLLLLFPPILWLLMRQSSQALAASVLLFVLTWQFNWNLPSYPSGHWFFNPFAWQLLFVFGAWCALGGAQRLSTVLESRATLVVAAAYLVFAFLISLTWYLPAASPYVPQWLEELIYPIDKVNLDGPFCTAGLAGPEVPLVAATDHLRPAFARNLLPRRISLVRSPFRHDRGVARALDAGACKRIRHSHNDCGCWAAHMV